MPLERFRPNGMPDPGLAFRAACRALRIGGLVAFPTDTVYGLGADPRDPEAVRRLFVAKGRPEEKAIPLLVGSLDAMDLYCDEEGSARRLAEAFWPGPLTIVAPASPDAPTSVQREDGTIGIRMPDHPVALGLLRLFDYAIATTSANRSGNPSLGAADDVAATLGGHLAVLLDAPCGGEALPSTVVRVCPGERPVVLRQGSIRLEAIERALGLC